MRGASATSPRIRSRRARSSRCSPYFAALERRWPIATTRRALEIGATWAVLTVVFEFGFGHWVGGQSWTELARDYDLSSGRLFSLVLLWVGVGPAVVRALRRR